MTHLIEDKDIEVRFLNKIKISDHVPIEIKLKHEGWDWKELKLNKRVKNKKFMAEVSREVLRRIYLAENLKETMQAFEYR